MTALMHEVANRAALAVAADDIHPTELWYVEHITYEFYESLSWRVKVTPDGVNLHRLGQALTRRPEFGLHVHIEAHTVDIFTEACGWQGPQPYDA